MLSIKIARCVVQIVVVANPANTNALILKENAPEMPVKTLGQRADGRFARPGAVHAAHVLEHGPAADRDQAVGQP
jgi:hypothetical protein